MTIHQQPRLSSLLATEGGSPVREKALPPWPRYDTDEIEKVGAVLRSGRVNYWTGEEGEAFEREFARYLDRQHALTITNGTAALELGLRALGIRDGDEVIVTPRSFFASVSTIMQCGARPVFVDVDRQSQNISAKTIAPAVTDKTRAILLVHLAGWPCEMDAILDLADQHRIKVIEDCAQAHGARYRGRPAGTFGHVAAFSFCQDKIMSTCGEGGLLVTDDAELWRRAWSYRDHGKSFEAVYERQHVTSFRWLHEAVGGNYRMTESQAAVGRLQLEKLEDWVRIRRRNAGILTAALSDLPLLRMTVPSSEIYHSYYKYYCFLRPELLKSGWSRERVIAAVQAEGVSCGSGSCPEIYLEGACVEAKIAPRKRLPIARELGETSLMFPVHPTLEPEDVGDICTAVRKVVEVACR